MMVKDIRRAESEAREFLRRIEDLKKDFPNELSDFARPDRDLKGTRTCASLKRKSHDLSEALVALRRDWRTRNQVANGEPSDGA